MAKEHEQDSSELSDEALDAVAGGKRVWPPRDEPIITLPEEPIIGIDPPSDPILLPADDFGTTA